MTVSITETTWRDRVMRKCGQSLDVKQPFWERRTSSDE